MKKTRIQEIDDEIARLREEKCVIQSKCSHPSVIRKGRGDSGNILTGRDPSSWYACECELCGKHWNEPQ